jgi:hypothetical protein
MALLPLRNALSGLDSLPTAMNFRQSPSDPAAQTDVLWDVAQTYFKNDVVLSASNGGAFMFTGLGPAKTSLVGGADPYDDSFSADPNWVSLAPPGLTDVTSSAATATLAAAANSVAVVTAGSLSLPAGLATGGAVYQLTWQGTWATAGNVAFTATDKIVWSFTPDGTAAVVVRSSVAPGVVISPYHMSGSLVVSVPVDGTQITGSISVGADALGVAPTLSDIRVTYARIL